METAKLNLSGEFTAAELEDIIRELAKVRSGMQPPVAGSPYELTNEVLQDEDGLVIAKPLRDRRVRLWVRNAGIGWFCLQLPQGAAIALRDQLVLATDPSRQSNLVDEQAPGKSGLN